MEMMEMMKKMMCGDSNTNMCMDMMKNMMNSDSSKDNNSNDCPNVPSEVFDLFEEWSMQIELEVLNIIEDSNNINLEKIAEKLKLSKSSIEYFLKKLAEKDKIKYTP